jgi:YVTN family beta-propeller protein
MKAILLLGLAGPLLAGTVRIYVANTDGETVSIIDPVANRVAGEIRVSKNPHAFIVSPDRKRFYSASESEDVLDVIDSSSSKLLRRVPIGRRPNNLAITADGKRVYVCIRQESWVDVIDTESMEKVKSIPVGRNPHNVYLTPDKRWMVATSMGDNKLTFIDVKTEKPDFEIPLPGIPRPVAIDAAMQNFYIQLSKLHGFIVLDFPTRKVVNKVVLPDGPPGAKPLIPDTYSHGMGIQPGGKAIWVTSLLDNSVSVYSLPELKRLATIPTGHGPDWMTFTPDGARCYVSNAGSDSVSVLDTASKKELTRISVGKIPKRIITVEWP